MLRFIFSENNNKNNSTNDNNNCLLQLLLFVAMPFQLVSQSHYLIQTVEIVTCWMTNSEDLDQLASSEASWSGSALFSKTKYIRVQQDKG